MKLRQSFLLLIAIANFAASPVTAKAQSLVDSSEIVASTAPQADLVYTRPTQEIKLRNYVFDAFGPYPIAGAAAVAGIGQIDNTPAAWGQGLAGYDKRFGSALGIAAISTTTRYALAEAFKEDTLYYRCECKGILPRLRHAVVSTLTARHGEDGHTRFLLLCFHRALCGYGDGCVRLVSRQLWRPVCAANGQLQPAGKRWRKHPAGVLLQRPTFPSFRACTSIIRTQHQIREQASE